MKYTIWIALALVVGCSQNPVQLDADLSASPESADVQAVPGESFRIRVGEVASIAGGGIVIGFRRVAADSRCPRDVTCVWAGDAAVELGIAPAGGEWAWHTLHTGIEPREFAAEGFSIRLVGLEPAPGSDVQVGQRDYVAELLVSGG